MDKKDNIFLTKKNVDFEFNEDVANVFDDMIHRSVPFYEEQQRMVIEICKKFYQQNTNIYDLGCSTGSLLEKLSKEMPKDAKFIGVDASSSMIEKAKQRLSKSTNIQLILSDINDIKIENASLVIMNYTLQFIRPLYRDKIVKKIYNGLNENGAFIVLEKILGENSLLNRFYIDFYYDFKKRMGYSELEISRKREALENILIPFRVSENIELFSDSGFEIIDIFFRWYNWAGFLCIKKPKNSKSKK